MTKQAIECSQEWLNSLNNKSKIITYIYVDGVAKEL